MLLTMSEVPAPNHFLLVVADGDGARLSEPSAYEIAQHRLRVKNWCLGERTPHRRAMVRGAKLVIYAAGKREHGGCIVGLAEAAGSPEAIAERDKQTMANNRFSRHLRCQFIVGLRDCKLLPHPLSLRELRHKLSFVTEPDSPKWGNRLQAGVVALTAADFRCIASAGGLAKRQRHGSR
jgi:hypothetical protein